MRHSLSVNAIVGFLLIAAPAGAQTWILGEMGYRVSVVPEGSPAARAGLHVGDVLAEPGPLVGRLREAPTEGVDIPVFRFDKSNASYAKTTQRVTFTATEEKRLGTTGDLGFIVTGATPGSLGARAELKTGDFITQIDDTFVHDVKDLSLVDIAYEKNQQVLINFVRWIADAGDFKKAVSRRRFVK